MITFLLGPFVCLFVCLFVSQSSLHLVRFGQMSCFADTRIVNIMRMYIERNKMQVELIRFRENILSFFTFTFAKRIIQCNIVHRTQLQTAAVRECLLSPLCGRICPFNFVHHSIEWCSSVFRLTFV